MEKWIASMLVAVIFHMTNAGFPYLSKEPFVHKTTANLDDPLILTPYIDQGKLDEARTAALVPSGLFGNITSYSGYFNVDRINNGNLFFWFFPSQNSYHEDPVILWLQGGPGSSSLFGLFVENGPFIISENLSVSLREYSWTRNHSVLYIDQPVGTGYSFTNGEIPSDQYKVAEHLYTALIQFFTLFSEIQNNSFFISGESYAGKYIPAIAYAIHERNPYSIVKINLQGLLIGNGLSDPIHQFNFGDLLYQLGLIDEPTRKNFQEQEKDFVELIQGGHYIVATLKWGMMVTNLRKTTGLGNIYNFIKDVDDSPTSWEDFVVRDDIRQAIHVGNQDYSMESMAVSKALYFDIPKSVAPWISELLNYYRVLIYNGQLDMIVAYPLTANYLQNLNFSAAAEYQTAKRNIWHVDGRVAGYVKTAGNLTEVLVRGAGHMVPMEQPKFAFDLVYSFIRNINIANRPN